MSYGQRLEQRKSRKSQPEGRQSWEGAENQVRGNLNWMLKHFEPEEIIEKMASEVFKQEKDVYPVKERHKHIKILLNYFSEMEKRCESELSRIEEVTEIDDINLNEEIPVDNFEVKL